MQTSLLLRSGTSAPRNALTPRELQVIELVRQAKPNKIIAYELGLTHGTVKEYLHHIFRKTGASNRTDLALRAELALRASVPEAPAA
jgi:DNA-binding NarL/FixJ family response regulator